MHELSIAIAIVEQATEEAERRGGVRVHAVHVKVGPLSGVVKDALEFAWETACDGTPIQGARLYVEDVPIVMRCSTCRAERDVIGPQDLRCVVCGSPGYPWEMAHGNELEFSAMEIEDDLAPTTGGSAPEHSEEK